MMSDKITESAIEKFAIELLEKLGYQYIYAPSIAPDSDSRHSEIENRKSEIDIKKSTLKNRKSEIDIRKSKIENLMKMCSS